jgi:hypothetical protein
VQLPAPPELGLAVDGDRAVGQQRLGVTTGIHEVGQLEQLPEANRVVADRNVTHAPILPLPAQGHPPAGAHDGQVSDPQDHARPTNPFATASLGLALLALVLGAVVRFGAAVGLIAVVLGGIGVARAEKTDVGLAASLFGVAFGVLAVLWTAVTIVSS